MKTLGRSQEAYDRFSEFVELPLTILGIAWLPVLIIPLVAKLSPGLDETFLAIDYFVWAAFAVEYLVKFYLAPSRRRFFARHLLDLAIVALPLLRPLRFLRLARLLNLGRVGVVLANALKRARALLTHQGLHFVLLSVLAIVLASSDLEFLFEKDASGSTIHSFGDSLWWAVVTVTTVGYGDKYPVTPGGRGVAIVLMLVGIGLIGVLTATVASYFIGQGNDGVAPELNDRLDRIEAALAGMLESSSGEVSSVKGHLSTLLELKTSGFLTEQEFTEIRSRLPST